MLNLETHIPVFAVDGSLQSAKRTLLAGRRWSVSAIVFWKLAKLIQLGRLDMDLDDRRVKRVLAHLHFWPIDLDVARATTRLDFRGDPADEIIAATSVMHDVPLLTRDRIIARSKLVPLAAPA